MSAGEPSEHVEATAEATVASRLGVVWGTGPFWHSPEWRRRRVLSNIVAVLGALCAVAAVILWANVADNWGSFEYPVTTALWISSISTSVAALVLGLIWYARWATAVGAFRDRLDQERADAFRVARDAVAPQAEGELTRLLEANRALLDDYQRPVRAQARTSYTLSQVAIVVGLLVLLAGVGVTLAASSPSAQLGVAGVTAVGAAVSGYIARTFLRVYERAQDQLNFYFREPLVTSYLLAAERLAEKLSGERRECAYAEMVGEIVRALGGDVAGGQAIVSGQSRRGS
jgi:hypothetical protein